MTGPSSGGLLAVHAHPDDETLATGALLATWADAGLPVTVVTCTRGELGEVIGPALAHLEGDGPTLAAHRERELAAALVALGVTDHLFLDSVEPVPGGPLATPGRDARFSDSGMCWAGAARAGRLEQEPDGAFVSVPLDDAAGRLAWVLRDRRPAVVATYDPGGGYGHPDHVRAHEVTARAVTLAAAAGWAPGTGSPYRVAAVLWAVRAESSLRAGYRELAATAALRGTEPGLTLPSPVGPMPSLVVPDAAVELAVTVGPVLERLRAALRAHGTQVQAVTIRSPIGPERRLAGDVVGSFALSNGVLVPLFAVEEYRFAPGARSEDVVWPTGVRRVA